MDTLGQNTGDGPRVALHWAQSIMASFPELREGIGDADIMIRRLSPVDDVMHWQDTVKSMFLANLGSALLREYFDLSRIWPSTANVDELAVIGQSAARTGSLCGSGSAIGFLRQWRQIALTQRHRDTKAYCLGVERIAAVAPEAADAAIRHLTYLASRLDGSAFLGWIHAGLRAYGHDRQRLSLFFDMNDELSLKLLAQDTDDDFVRLERRMRGILVALWGEKRQLSPLLKKAVDVPVPLRPSLVGGILRLPGQFPGFTGKDATAIFRAATAHAGAHYHYSTAVFPVKKLRPLQIALISLIEDARIETLAIDRYPGLRALWLPFHATTNPENAGSNAVGLMARLSRALIDPSYMDADAWIIKARTLFQEARSHLHDPLTSREIGGLLGSDLGQMRVQFNIKTYVVEPAYRDDNLAIWDFGEQQDAQQEVIDLHVESIGARTIKGDTEEAGSQQEEKDTAAPPRSAAVAEIDSGEAISYPEWDCAIGYERPDWVTLRLITPPTAQITRRTIDTAVSEKLLRIARSISIGRRTRQKRLSEGETIDLDAAIEFEIQRRIRNTPDERIFQRSTAGPRDLAALLLIDLSQSTADRDDEGQSVLSLEIEAATAIGQAMHDANDILAIDGFCSEGRDNIHYTLFKDFSEPFDRHILQRLAGADSSYSTRLGAALRHSAKRLQSAHAFRRVLIVLTDGEPSDIDVPDVDYLREDARHVVRGVKHLGIDSFAFGIGTHASPALVSIFGRKRALHVPRASLLPKRLMQLYDELRK